jgi:hypothetical protein
MAKTLNVYFSAFSRSDKPLSIIFLPRKTISLGRKIYNQPRKIFGKVRGIVFLGRKNFDLGRKNIFLTRKTVFFGREIIFEGIPKTNKGSFGIQFHNPQSEFRMGNRRTCRADLSRRSFAKTEI